MVDYAGTKTSKVTKIDDEANQVMENTGDPFVLQLIAADIAFNGWGKYQSVTGRMDNHKAKQHIQRIVELATFIRTTLAD